MAFAANMAVEQEVVVTAVMIVFFISTHLLMYTNTRLTEVE